MLGRSWYPSSTRSQPTRRPTSCRLWNQCAAHDCEAVPRAGTCTESGKPDLFLEQFQVPTWREHQRQHDGRLTAEDQAIEDAAFTHIVGAPRAQHLLPPGTPATLSRLMRKESGVNL